MPKRKVVMQGRSTFTISLPVSWARKFRLKENSELNIEEKGNTLIISAPEKKVKKKISFDVKKTKILTNRALLNAYQYGYNEIKLLQCNQDINQVLSELVGFEIVEKKGTTLIIKEVADIKENNIHILFRRLFLITQEIFEEGYKLLKKKDFKGLQDLIKKDTHINRYNNLIIRFLAKYGYNQQEHVPFLISIASAIENVGDQLKNFFAYIIKAKSIKNILLYEDIQELFNLCYRFHFTKKMDIGKQIADQYNFIIKKIFQNDAIWSLFPFIFYFDLANTIIQIQGKQLCLGQ